MSARESSQHKPVDPYSKSAWPQSELLAADFAPVAFLVDGLVIDGGVTILAGKAKVGKSWLGLQVAQCVALGLPVLGRESRRGPALYYALEDGMKRIRGRLIRQAYGDAHVVYLPGLRPLDREGMEDLEQDIREHGPRLVIIDTLAACKTGRVDENQAGPMAEILNHLQRLAQTRDVGILVIAHHGKTTGRGAGDDIRGSSAIPAAADLILSLLKTETGHSLEAQGRDIDELRMTVALEPERRIWEPAEDSRAVARRNTDEAVLEALDSLGEASIAEVAEHTGQSPKWVQKVLTRLRSDGIVERRTDDESARGRQLYRRAEQVDE